MGLGGLIVILVALTTPAWPLVAERLGRDRSSAAMTATAYDVIGAFLSNAVTKGRAFAATAIVFITCVACAAICMLLQAAWTKRKAQGSVRQALQPDGQKR